MRHSNRWSIYATGLLALASCDPEPPSEDVAFRSSPLDDGASKEDPYPHDCEVLPVFETLQTLCDMLGIECPTVSQGPGPNLSACGRFRRQIFTGVTNPDNSPVPLVGRGRAGHALADAMLCTMRELSPELGGPKVMEAPVSLLGIGDVVARQEIGFLSFDREAHAFKGYRRLQFELPVFGTLTSSAQTFSLEESSVTTWDTSSTTGAVGEITGWGLDLTANERSQILQFDAPSFTVPTPIGAFSVTPQFDYETHTRVIDAPYDNSVDFDIANWGFPGVTLHFDDLYGVLPGLQYAMEDVTVPTLPQHQNKGWFSGLALGTRSAEPDTPQWTPAAGSERPNYDLLKPRSTEETLPTTYVRVAAPLKYPDNPWDLLPSWLRSFRNATTVDAYIELTPSLEAGVGGQLALATHEGAHFRRRPDGTLEAFNLSTFAIQAQSRAEAGFEVSLTLHLEFKIKVPIVGEVALLNVHKKIPIIPDSNGGHSDQKMAWGYAIDGASSLEAIVEFDGTEHIGQDATEAFLEACFAEEVEDQDVTPWEVVPDDGAKLFWQGLFPCNICVAVDEKNVGTESNPYWIGAQVESMIPSDDPSSWQCDREAKTGCMDLCWYNADTGSLTVAYKPTWLAMYATAAGDHDLATFYNRCMD